MCEHVVVYEQVCTCMSVCVCSVCKHVCMTTWCVCEHVFVYEHVCTCMSACVCVGGVRGRPIFDCERNKPTVVFNPRSLGAIGEFYEIG